MSYIGHPLLGDFLYHPTDTHIGRHALHVASLSFTHPITGLPLEFNMRLPDDMAALLT